jgi:predicted nucleotide-binding protein
MDSYLIAMSFKALAEVIKAIVSKKSDPRSSRSDTLNPDVMEQYNRLAAQVIQQYPEAPLTTFKNIESPNYASYPKAIEVLGQIKIGLAILEKEISPDHNETADSKTGPPKVFIGCSVEGLAPAKIIQLNLSHSAKTEIWSQGVFGLSSGTLESLTNKANDYDYAILVLTPDDIVVKRGETQMSARDNVLFELGLFMGALGRHKTFIVAEETVKLPSDLAGITPATYSMEGQENIVSALGPVCTKIELEMGTL